MSLYVAPYCSRVCQNCAEWRRTKSMRSKQNRPIRGEALEPWAMRIWTIQSQAAWDYLKRNDVLRARREHQDKNCPNAYRWIEDQLIKRVGPPPDANAVPLWGWYRWLGEDKCRPDLRSVRHRWGEAGGQFCLIECEFPDSSVLLSDYDAWHLPLNDMYVGTDDEDAIYAEKLARYREAPDEELRAHLYEEFYGSWERILDLELLGEPDWHSMGNKSIQACFWEIRMEQVISTRPFVTTGRSR